VVRRGDSDQGDSVQGDVGRKLLW